MLGASDPIAILFRPMDDSSMAMPVEPTLYEHTVWLTSDEMPDQIIVVTLPDELSVEENLLVEPLEPTQLKEETEGPQTDLMPNKLEIILEPEDATNRDNQLSLPHE